MKARFSLEIRRLIPASPARVFAAWTDPVQLEKWWGPAHVRCVSAEIDLRIGGRYRIGNELPDKSIVWIEGTFEQIEHPSLLVYTWRAGTESAATEIVTVRVTRVARGTQVLVTHDRIESPAVRDQHGQGWEGCLDGLSDYLSAQRSGTPVS